MTAMDRVYNWLSDTWDSFGSPMRVSLSFLVLLIMGWVQLRFTMQGDGLPIILPSGGLGVAFVLVGGPIYLVAVFASTIIIFAFTPSMAAIPALGGVVISLVACGRCWLARYLLRGQKVWPTTRWTPVTLLRLGLCGIFIPCLVEAVLVGVALYYDSLALWTVSYVAQRVFLAYLFGGLVFLPLALSFARGFSRRVTVCVGVATFVLLTLAGVLWDYSFFINKDMAAREMVLEADRAMCTRALNRMLLRNSDVVDQMESYLSAIIVVPFDDGLKQFISPLVSQRPEVVFTAWVPYVPDSERAQYEKTRGPLRSFRTGNAPVPRKPYYYPLYSTSRSVEVVFDMEGCDIASEEPLRDTIDWARRSGDLAVSPCLHYDTFAKHPRLRFYVKPVRCANRVLGVALVAFDDTNTIDNVIELNTGKETGVFLSDFVRIMSLARSGDAETAPIQGNGAGYEPVLGSRRSTIESTPSQSNAHFPDNVAYEIINVCHNRMIRSFSYSEPLMCSDRINFHNGVFDLRFCYTNSAMLSSLQGWSKAQWHFLLVVVIEWCLLAVLSAMQSENRELADKLEVQHTLARRRLQVSGALLNGLVWSDIKGSSPLLLSKRAEILLGYDPDTLTADNLHETLHPLELCSDIACPLRFFGKHGHAWPQPDGSATYTVLSATRETVVRCANGANLGVDYRVYLLNEDDETVALVWDFVENKQRLALSRMKDTFSDHVSHELRTPLAAFVGAIDLLQFSGSGAIKGELTPQGVELIQMARRNGMRMVRLVDDVLAVQQIERGAFVLDITKVEVSSLLHKLITNYETENGKLRVSIKMQVPAGLKVYADERRLVRVFWHLLDNAVDHSPEGKEVTISATISGERNRFVEFSVTDEGHGIPSVELARIFEPFTIVDSHEVDLQHGVGLGLSLVRGIVESHGGSVWVESQVGEGSTFYFTVPRYRTEAQREAQGVRVGLPDEGRAWSGGLE